MSYKLFFLNCCLEHMELCSTLCGSLYGRGAWGRLDTCICVAESPHCSPETITTLLISHTPIQKKNFKKIKKELLSDIFIAWNSHIGVYFYWKMLIPSVTYLFRVVVVFFGCYLHCCLFAELCLTPCNPMDRSMAVFPVLHYLLEFTQTLARWVTDAIQPSHLLLPPSPPVLNLFQHQGLFQ